ncbi:RING-type E3 ubiquitin transferase [Trifolium repens]|nr:RING-type E3 ubiquitin transferase [Trifolium repens]
MENEQWCSICSKMVSPMIESRNKCPFCETQFGVEMENLRDHNNDAIDLRSAWVFSLYAPIFLGLMNAFSPSLATISSQASSTSRNEENIDQQERGNYNELVIGRRRRTSTYMMHLFRGLHVRMVSENENIEQNRNNENNNNNTTNNNSIFVIDPFNEGALIVRGPNLNHTTMSDENNSINANINTTIGSLNDFVDGSGFDLLLQHLAQINPSGYASVNPPTKKEAIEEMENVINDEKLQCTICLEDVEIGSIAKEMPFCRFQMPCEDSNVLANLENGNRENQNNEVVRGRNGRRNWFPVLQSFNNFLPFP